MVPAAGVHSVPGGGRSRDLQRSRGGDKPSESKPPAGSGKVQ